MSILKIKYFKYAEAALPSRRDRQRKKMLTNQHLCDTIFEVVDFSTSLLKYELPLKQKG